MRCFRPISLALLGLALAIPVTASADDSCPTCKTDKQKQKHRHGFRSMRVCETCMRAQRAASGGAALPPPMVASVGTCSACQAQAMAASVPSGYATSGGAMMAGEPAPVGVVQASYQPAGAGSSSAPGHAVVGPNTPASSVNWGSPNFVAPGRHGRPHVLATLFGLPRFGEISEAYGDRKRQEHAATAYGPNGQAVSELPAWMVYNH